MNLVKLISLLKDKRVELAGNRHALSIYQSTNKKIFLILLSLSDYAPDPP
jgi:uncharacterized UBP type Zn finger protein